MQSSVTRQKLSYQWSIQGKTARSGCRTFGTSNARENLAERRIRVCIRGLSKELALKAFETMFLSGKDRLILARSLLSLLMDYWSTNFSCLRLIFLKALSFRLFGLVLFVFFVRYPFGFFTRSRVRLI
jgi:hypothetical protein